MKQRGLTLLVLLFASRTAMFGHNHGLETEDGDVGLVVLLESLGITIMPLMGATLGVCISPPF